MTTTPIPLTNTAWVDLGATPLVVCTIDDRNPAVLVVADAAPASLTAQGLVVSSKNVDGQVINGNGQHVYARALNHLTTVIVLPYSGGGSGGSGSVVALASATIARITVALPPYATGGTATITDATGAQTTVTVAANKATPIAAANVSRKYAFAANATPNTSISIGYADTVAPGNSYALDGPNAAGGQGGSREWSVPPANAIYAASATSATLVFEQGQ